MRRGVIRSLIGVCGAAFFGRVEVTSPFTAITSAVSTSGTRPTARTASVTLATTFVHGWDPVSVMIAGHLARRAVRAAAALGQTIEKGGFIHDPDVFQTVMQIVQPVLVARVEAVATVHLQLALSHLLGLLDLVLGQLDARRGLIALTLAGSLRLLVLVSLLLLLLLLVGGR